MSAPIEWDWGDRSRRVTSATLARGIAINSALLAIAEAAHQRIAAIPDDPDDEDNTSAPTTD